MDGIIQKAKEYHDNALIVGVAHFKSGKSAFKKHMQLGIPTVITSTLVSTSIFINLLKKIDSKNQDILVFIALILSLLAAVLVALQTFFKFAEIAAKHKAAGSSYATLRRKIDIFLLRLNNNDEFKNRSEASEAIDILESIGCRLSELANECPDIAERYYEEAHEQVRKENKLLLELPETKSTAK